ncbi:hypothetical protein HDU85_002977 [Gaertneriomyces sp. JEL0708]|nr:hypothetical protein HDU85_002977 [Gaertneriomyces sp. JEL0708]
MSGLKKWTALRKGHQKHEHAEPPLPAKVVDVPKENPALPLERVQAVPTKGLWELCQETNLKEVAQGLPRIVPLIRKSINTPLDAHHNTILHLAATMNDYPLTCLLVLRGADPNIKNRGGVNPTTIARRLAHRKLLHVLRSHGGQDEGRKQDKKEKRRQAVQERSGWHDRRTRDGIGRLLPHQEVKVVDCGYLGLDACLTREANVLGIWDAGGWNVVHKAAYRGHADLMATAIAKGVEADVPDRAGNTPLVYAALQGHLDCVKVLVERGACLNGSQTMNGGVRSLSPLVAACWNGHTTIAEYLLDRGADINAGVGLDSARTPIMFAGWALHEECVRLLIMRGAQTDGVDWLRTGVVHKKKAGNIWIGSSNGGTQTLEARRGSTGTSITLASERRRMSLKEKFEHFTTEETSILASLEGLLHAAKLETKAHKGRAGDLHETGSDDSLSTVRSRNRGTRGKRNTFRQGMNLDKLFGTAENPALLNELTSSVPQTGTELDHSCAQVFQLVMQLLISANRNKKDEYIVIQAKAIHYSSEIVRAVEVLDQNLSNDPSALFIASPLHKKIRDLAKRINDELPKQLMLTTRIAIGVWPPSNAMSEMVRAATALAKACRELVDLANCTGGWPILEKRIEISFAPHELGDEPSKSAPTPATRLTYDEYKRQQNLKLLDEISKHSPAAGSTDSLTTTTTTTDMDRDTDFANHLDDLVKQVVAATKEITQAKSNHLKHQFVSLTSTAAHATELLVDEIRGYQLFKEWSPETDVMLSEEDTETLANNGVEVSEDLPVSLFDLWQQALASLQDATRHITYTGKLASGVLPPPDASAEMQGATISLLLAVRRFVVLTKECVTRVREVQKLKGKEEGRYQRELVMHQRVRQLFGLLEREGGPGGEEVAVDIEEWEGLHFDGDTLKGGRLTKLVEWMTKVGNWEQEFVATLFLTHHSFTTSLELLDLLLRRYNLTAPPNLTRQQFESYLEKVVVPIKQRVCMALKYWIATHFEEDFSTNDLLLFRVRDFLNETLREDNDKLAAEITALMEEKLNSPTATKHAATTPTVMVPPKLPKLSVDVYTYLTSHAHAFLDVDPMEMCRQLSLLEHSYLSRIKAYEFTEGKDGIWGARRMKELAALGAADRWTGGRRLHGMINHTNAVATWIMSSIVSAGGDGEKGVKERRDVLKYFCNMAVHCTEIKNYNLLTAISGGLANAAIGRLHKTWGALKEKNPKLAEAYEEAVSLVAPRGQYANYRRMFKELTPPAVPYCGVSLTDLTFIDLGNPDYLPDSGHINFDKRTKVYQLFQSQIFPFQTTPLPFTAVPGILDFFRDLRHFYKVLTGAGNQDAKRRDQLRWESPLLSEEEGYNTSLAVEPREEEESEGSDEFTAR